MIISIKFEVDMSDYPSPSYGVVAADTLRDFVTLTFNLLALNSGHTWRVTWSRDVDFI